MKDGFLDNLRKKDKTRRQRIALIVSLSITLVIFGSWFIVWSDRLKPETKDVISKKEKSIASPLSSFKERLDDIMESGIEQFDTLKGKFESEFMKEVVDFGNENEYNSQEEILEKDVATSTSEQEDIEY